MPRDGYRYHDFTGYVVPELERIGFRDIQTDCTPAALVGLSLVNIIAEYGDNGESRLKHLKELKTSVICPLILSGARGNGDNARR